jgi:hypothetical protein
MDLEIKKENQKDNAHSRAWVEALNRCVGDEEQLCYQSLRIRRMIFVEVGGSRKSIENTF